MKVRDFLKGRYTSYTTAFRNGAECALDWVDDNLLRLSLDDLKDCLRDHLKRSETNYEYAPNDEAKQFQQGYQAVCKHFLGVNV